MSNRKNYSNYYKEKGEDLIRGLKEGVDSENVDAKNEVTKNITEVVEVIEGEYPGKDHEREMIPILAKVVNCNKLNVRKEPNANSEIVTVLDEGATVEIISTDIRGFRKVKTTDLKGYCMSFYIEETE